MIRLTQTNGLPIYVPDGVLIDHKIPWNPLRAKEGEKPTTFVVFGENEYPVTESPEEVARKVLEYKLAMERYKSSNSIHDRQRDEEELLSLAGLRDSPLTDFINSINEHFLEGE